VKDLDLIWDLSLKDLGFETKKMGFEIWLSDLNPFLERFEISVKENKEKPKSVFIPNNDLKLRSEIAHHWWGHGDSRAPPLHESKG